MADARYLLDAPSTVAPERAALALRQTLVAYARYDRGGARRLRLAGRLLLEHGDSARVALWLGGAPAEDTRGVDALLAQAGVPDVWSAQMEMEVEP